MKQLDDNELYRRFRILRESDARKAGSFQRVIDAKLRRRSAVRVRKSFALGLVAAGIFFTTYAVVRQSSSSHTDSQASIAEWRANSDFLIAFPPQLFGMIEPLSSSVLDEALP